MTESHLLKMEIKFYSSLNWIDVHSNAAGWIDINRKGENDGEGNTANALRKLSYKHNGTHAEGYSVDLGY